jgi:hypothetical protein
LRTVRSITYSRQASASTARPVHSRAVARCMGAPPGSVRCHQYRPAGPRELIGRARRNFDGLSGGRRERVPQFAVVLRRDVDRGHAGR